jgi:integrase/recombinase XerC
MASPLCRGSGPGGVELINDYLGYLADRGYSPRTVRAYAFDLLALARWLVAERLAVDEITTEVLLRFLAFCRSAPTPARPGGNVYSIRDGRNSGFAARTINRRLAAISGLFCYRQMRDGSVANPVPRGGPARRAAGEHSGLLAHLRKPKQRSRLRVREPRRLPRGLDREETTALLGSLRTDRDRAIAGLNAVLRAAFCRGARPSGA